MNKWIRKKKHSSILTERGKKQQQQRRKFIHIQKKECNKIVRLLN